MEALEGGAPPEVTLASGGVGVAGALPSADVVGAGGEQERLIGLGAQGADPAGHHLGVGGLLGPGDAADGQPVGVGGVGLVDAADGLVEAGGHGAVVLVPALSPSQREGGLDGALRGPLAVGRGPLISIFSHGRRGLWPASGVDFAGDDGGEGVDEGRPGVEGLDAGERRGPPRSACSAAATSMS